MTIPFVDTERTQPTVLDVGRPSSKGDARQLEALLFIAYYFPPDNESGAERPARFAKYLVAEGVPVYVVSSRQYGSNLPLPAVSTVAREASSLLQRLLPYNEQLPWLPQAQKAIRRLMRKHSVSAIFSTSPPTSAHLAALYVKRRTGLKWVADLRDPISGNPFRSKTRARLYDRWIEKQIVMTADAVISNADPAARELRNRYPGFAHKIYCIPNGFDASDPVAAQPLPSRSYKLLVHTGSIYGPRHPGRLLTALDRMIASGTLPKGLLRVRLIGDLDDSAEWLQECDFARLLREGWLECISTRVPKAMARHEAATADYLLLLDVNGHDTPSLQVPAKLYEYIRIGRPILAFTTKGSSVEAILRKSGIRHALVYEETPPAEVADILQNLLQMPTEPVPPSPWFCEKFDASAHAKILQSIFEQICGSPKGEE